MLELGLTISLSGNRDLQERPRSAGIRRQEIPPDRLLVETDCPFLAPVLHRGKTCEPRFHRRHTAEFVAELRGRNASERWPRATHPQLSTRCSPRRRSTRAGRVKLSCSAAALRPACRGASATTGANAIPNEPKNRRTRVSILVQSDEGSAPAGRHFDRHAAAVAGQRHRQGRRRCSGPTTPPITATASTTRADALRPQLAVARLRLNRDRAQPAQRFGYVFAGRYGYPTIVQTRQLERVKIHAGFAIGSRRDAARARPRRPGFGSKLTANQSVMPQTSARSPTEMVALFKGARHPRHRLPAPRDRIRPMRMLADRARTGPNAAGARDHGADASRQVAMDYATVSG